MIRTVLEGQALSDEVWAAACSAEAIAKMSQTTIDPAITIAAPQVRSIVTLSVMSFSLAGPLATLRPRSHSDGG